MGRAAQSSGCPATVGKHATSASHADSGPSPAATLASRSGHSRRVGPHLGQGRAQRLAHGQAGKVAATGVDAAATASVADGRRVGLVGEDAGAGNPWRLRREPGRRPDKLTAATYRSTDDQFSNRQRQQAKSSCWLTQPEGGSPGTNPVAPVRTCVYTGSSSGILGEGQPEDLAQKGPGRRSREKSPPASAAGFSTDALSSRAGVPTAISAACSRASSRRTGHTSPGGMAEGASTLARAVPSLARAWRTCLPSSV